MMTCVGDDKCRRQMKVSGVGDRCSLTQFFLLVSSDLDVVKKIRSQMPLTKQRRADIYKVVDLSNS